MGGGNEEREQTLNQLLIEMDGFDGNENIIVIAATNRSDILDPALLRPGRFDRKVLVGLPDVKGREAILKVHAKNKPLAEDVNLKVVAQQTPGFVGADLENVLRGCFSCWHDVVRLRLMLVILMKQRIVSLLDHLRKIAKFGT